MSPALAGGFFTSELLAKTRIRLVSLKGQTPELALFPRAQRKEVWRTHREKMAIYRPGRSITRN